MMLFNYKYKHLLCALYVCVYIYQNEIGRQNENDEKKKHQPE